MLKSNRYVGSRHVRCPASFFVNRDLVVSELPTLERDDPVALRAGRFPASCHTQSLQYGGYRISSIRRPRLLAHRRHQARTLWSAGEERWQLMFHFDRQTYTALTGASGHGTCNTLSRSWEVQNRNT